ncbi:MAG: hypothetical protein JWP35_1718 [Caulobacter sp.]|nr:hypothetical protein [Caulobacter sp.]
MTRSLPAFVLAASLLAGSALAAPDLTPAFKGTIVSTYPSGRSARLFLNRDGTYTGIGAKGAHYAGTWKLKGEKVCLKQTNPTPSLFTFCQSIPNVGPGGTWASKSPKGEPLKNRLEPGR